MLDSQEAKLFIKVDGVIGDRKRICTFCNSTIHGTEKIVETTRKLRRGPYFPQLAYLQSSVGKIDTMGRAVVCLLCFHQLLRQWNSYEIKNIPMSKRTYKYVSDKGVKNYQETRAKEIRAEAEKRAFAIQTNQEHIVKKAFERLTKRLDAQEEIIRQSDECIESLKLQLTLCTKGEEWKINREIKKHQKVIDLAEARIEDEEDKEELIRKETKSLLEVYRNNRSLFRSVSEPNLFQGNIETTEEKPIAFEEWDHRDSAQKEEETPSKASSGRQMDSNHQSQEWPVQGVRRDVWTALEHSSDSLRQKPARNSSGWHMTKEIVYPAHSNKGQSFREDEWSKMLDKEQSHYNNQYNTSNTGHLSDRGQQESFRNKPESHMREEIVHPAQSNDVQSFPEDEWSKLFDKKQSNYENQYEWSNTEHLSDRGTQEWHMTSKVLSDNAPQEPVGNNPDRNMANEIVCASQSNDVQSFPEDEWSKLFDKEQSDYKDQCKMSNTEHLSDRGPQESHMTSREIVHPIQSKNVNPFPEDEWSKLFDKEQNDYENQCEDSESVLSSVTWNAERNQLPIKDTELTQIESEFAERGEHVWVETRRSDDSDIEQVYEVNPNLSSDSHHAAGRISPSTRGNDGRAVTQLSFEQPTKHEYNASPDTGVDPWDMIQYEKEKETDSHIQVQHTERRDHLSSGNVATGDYDNEYIDEHTQGNFERGDKVILSPGRLDPCRFSEFTRSSYIPEPVKEKPLRQQSRDKAKNSSKQCNGFQKIVKGNDVTIVESSIYVADESTRDSQQRNASDGSLEQLRENRNVYDRHLSLEEEEWERKYLNPKRLHKTRWVNFVDEEKRDVRITSLAQPGVYYMQEERSRFKDYPSEVRSSPMSERLIEINVERSPALRKLIKQDEISEEPVQRVTTRASVQSSPSWNELKSQKNEPENELVSDQSVGRLDLKRWSSEKDRNRSFERASEQYINDGKYTNEDRKRPATTFKQNSLGASQDAYNGEVVIINRNQSPKRAGDVYILESKNDSTSQGRMRPGSLKFKEKANFLDENSNSLNKPPNLTPLTRMKQTVIIEDDEQTMNHNDSYLNRKQFGKVNLGLWEQKVSSQNNTNNPNLPVKVCPTVENRSKPISPSYRQPSFPVNGDNSSQFDTDHINNQPMREREHANSPGEDSAYISHRSFNKSMSEDELAWEKRFSKTYEREISVEEPKQQKVSDQRVPRLNDVDENHVNFGIISLDEEEVRRVREHKTDVGTRKNYGRNADGYIVLKSSSHHGESSNPTKSSQSTTYSGDISQLTEEELSWEEKTSRPGRLDLSKFSQFH